MRRLIEKANTEYALCRIPGLVRTERGTLLGYYECRDSCSDWARIDLKVIRSEDRGEHFSRVLLVRGNGHTLNNPVMIVQGEVIHFLYCEEYRRIFHCVSRDDGRTFSAPREITEAVVRGGYPANVVALGPGHGILHRGVLLVPIWIATSEDPRAHKPSVLHVLYSCDGGATWQLGERISGEGIESPNESCLAVTREGRVLISIRQGGDVYARALAESENGYTGWSEARTAPWLPDPHCMGSMAHTATHVFHINCANAAERRDLTIRQSEDALASDRSILVDREGGYADIAVDSSEICVLYERDVFHKEDALHNDGLYFTRIRYDED